MLENNSKVNSSITELNDEIVTRSGEHHKPGIRPAQINPSLIGRLSTLSGACAASLPNRTHK